MKRAILTSIIATMAFPLFAQQYSGPGYYRLKNRGEAGRYISIENDKVSEESKKVSFSGGKSVYAAMESLKTVKNKDYVPGTIMFVTGQASDLTLEAQGENTADLLDKFGYSGYKLKANSQGELNTTYSGYQIDMIDFGFDYPVSRDGFCAVATLNYIRTNDIKYYALWDFIKIDNENEYFGIYPNENIKVGDKYYTTIFTTFAFKLREGMKAYYIDQHNYTGSIQEPIAELKEITDGIIPAATPVIIECSSNFVSDNKVTLLMEDQSPITGNELKGRVFCFVPSEKEDQNMKNALAFNESTMRVLGVKDGKLAMVADNNSALKNITKSNGVKERYIPANKAYLPISSSDTAATANGVKLLLPDEYAAATSISKVVSEEKPTKEGIYTLTGVKVKEGNASENLPNGIYIINGKKQVIR
jgi:hypothetical protein